jgi:FkbM family methyltransferase
MEGEYVHSPQLDTQNRAIQNAPIQVRQQAQNSRVTIHYDQNQPFAIKRCKYGLFAFSRNDTFIGRSLDQYGEWCEYELDLIRTQVGIGAIVLDVGANIGTHTLAFSHMVGDTGHVVAFEPQPRLYRFLAANLILNGTSNVRALREAVGPYIGDVPMAALPPDETIFNYGAVPLLAQTPNMITTPMITIDSLGLAPTLIKIDVEGMEADVLNGATETIRRHSPILYVENNGEESCRINAALDRINYRAWWSLGPYFNPHNHFGNPMDIWPGVVPSANLIALPKASAVGFQLPEFLGPEDNWMKAQERIVTE